MRRLSIMTIGAVLVLGIALGSRFAYAAVTGSIEGIVTDQVTHKPLAGVTVTATSQALQGEQTEFTDDRGHYIITELPPGEYTIRFYFSDVKAERPGIVLHADQTLQANGVIPTQAAEEKTYRITERAPSVDVANAQVETQITSELINNTPVSGSTYNRRGYDSVLTLTPGASSDVGSAGFGGSTGAENGFLIDGLNTTQITQGLLGTQLSLEFIHETDVITAGYNAEYGRATGGVVSVVTKSGSNEFHGGLWAYYTPFALSSPRVGGLGEAFAQSDKNVYTIDFGADLGGPIWKDKIWFYVGFVPTISAYDHTIYLRSRLNNDDPNPMPAPGMTTTYAGDQLKNVPGCPAWLASRDLCPAGNGGLFATQDIAGQAKTYRDYRKIYNGILKLDFQLSENNHFAIEYIASPTTYNGSAGGVGVDPAATVASNLDNIQDVLAHFVSKLFSRRLQLDVLFGYHWEQYKPSDFLNKPSIRYDATLPTTDFQNIPGCTPLYNDDATMTTPHTIHFNPCPVTAYRGGGLAGQLSQQTSQRFAGTIAATYFLHLFGTHAFKVGLDLEDNIFENRLFYAGGLTYRVRANGDVRYTSFGTVLNPGTPNAAVKLLPDGTDATTSTLNEAVYVRDSWNVGFVPGLTLNAGVRWEGQQVHASDGSTVINITDNVAPRLGFAYDFTRKGLSKLYFNYGRFYESIPLYMNDTQFTNGRGLVSNITAPASACMQDPIDPNHKLSIPSTCTFPDPKVSQISYPGYAAVAPGLKGEYINEFVAGVQYDIFYDLIGGIAYIHRDLGRLLEDTAPTGDFNNGFIIANPGDALDSDAVKSLQNQIAATTDAAKKATLQQKLVAYEGAATLPKPRRDYDALQITLNKRLTHNLIVLASYTYSRTLGNYPGSHDASYGQTIPNVGSNYDAREFQLNSYGPLPADRPHNFKISAGYNLPIGHNFLNLGGSFFILSGTPINVMGQDAHYDLPLTFILPRGSGGRTPTLSQLDLHVSYGRQVSKSIRMDLYADIFNVLNQQTVTSVNNVYTLDQVNAITNGTPADLKNLRTIGGTPATPNPNYGQATGYQAPPSVRFGARMSF